MNKPCFEVLKTEKMLILDNRWPICKNKIVESDFKDEISKKEFSISGMCQSCQDKTFDVTSEDVFTGW